MRRLLDILRRCVTRGRHACEGHMDTQQFAERDCPWAAGLSDCGLLRDRNEDAFLCDPGRRVFVVADGMGGHAAGDRASSEAVTNLDKALSVERLEQLAVADENVTATELEELLRRVNEAILAVADERSDLKGMGCTVVLAVILGSKLHVSNLGDSRAYLIRGDDVRILTRDHSWAAVLAEQGQLTSDEARNSPIRNQLTASLGQKRMQQPAYSCVHMQAGDRVLLCSDGLWDELSDQEISDLVHSHDDPRVVVQRLIESANKAGGNDNITAVVAFIGRTENWQHDCRAEARSAGATTAGVGVDARESAPLVSNDRER